MVAAVRQSEVSASKTVKIVDENRGVQKFIPAEYIKCLARMDIVDLDFMLLIADDEVGFQTCNIIFESIINLLLQRSTFLCFQVV
jgi:hypothetical protein